MSPSEGSRQQPADEATDAGVSGVRTPAVSVIVPVLRADGAFRDCLASLGRLDPACDDLVVAVDGGDADAALLAAGIGAQVVRLPERRGPAAARNAGARAARGDVLLFVDADVTLRPDAVARVVAALRAHPGCDAVIGSYDDAPAARNFLSQYKNLAHHFVHQTSREEAWTFWGACGAVRRDAFQLAGGFDERYARASIEDIELGSRLVAAGRRIRLEKHLQVTHLKRWTAGGLLRSEIFDRAIPWTRVILTTGRMPADLNLRWSGRVAVAAACLLAPALILAVRHPWARAVAAALALVQVGVDLPLIRFLRARRGNLFALRAIGWQWLHHVCCAIGFACGIAMHLAGADRPRAPFLAAGPIAHLSGDRKPK